MPERVPFPTNIERNSLRFKNPVWMPRAWNCMLYVPSCM